MKIQGRYDAEDWFCEVLVDGKELKPGRSQRVRNHSPDGFAWGYGGSGPAQLALAILLEAGCPARLARAHYQQFKWEFLATLPRDSFDLEVDVDAWVRRQGEEAGRSLTHYEHGPGCECRDCRVAYGGAR